MSLVDPEVNESLFIDPRHQPRCRLTAGKKPTLIRTLIKKTRCCDKKISVFISDLTDYRVGLGVFCLWCFCVTGLLIFAAPASAFAA